MSAQTQTEEEVIHQERKQSAAERRKCNDLAISEVIGRNPVKKQPHS
jgi:hypothetical protein